MEERSSLLPGPFSNLREINFGIVLLSIYILLDIGAFQGVFEIISKLRIPFLVAVISLLYAVYLVYNKKIDFRNSTTKRFAIFFFFIIVHSQLRCKVPGGARADLTLFIQYFSNYIIMMACVKTPFQFIFLIDIFLASIIHSCFHAIMQGGKLYDSIWLKDENHIAIISAYAIPFALVLFSLYKSKLKKICYIIGIFFYVTANVVAASRGGSLAMIGGGFLWWLTDKNKWKSLIIVLIAVSLVFSFAPPRFFSEMESLQEGTEEGTAGERIYLWGIAWGMFLDHPVLGIGPYNYTNEYIKYDVEDKYYHSYYEKGDTGKVAHSTPMQFLAENGIIGSILFLLLVICMYKNWAIVRKKINSVQYADEYEPDLKLFSAINNACGISHVVFWIAALFLTLTPYPFYWILIPFSEVWKNLTLNYIAQIPSNETVQQNRYFK